MTLVCPSCHLEYSKIPSRGPMLNGNMCHLELDPHTGATILKDEGEPMNDNGPRPLLARSMGNGEIGIFMDGLPVATVQGNPTVCVRVGRMVNAATAETLRAFDNRVVAFAAHQQLVEAAQQAEYWLAQDDRSIDPTEMLRTPREALAAVDAVAKP